MSRIPSSNAGIASFLKKARDQNVWRNTEPNKVRATMLTALGRFEKALDQANKRREVSEERSNYSAMEFSKALHIEKEHKDAAKKRTHEYIFSQIKQNVKR